MRSSARTSRALARRVLPLLLAAAVAWPASALGTTGTGITATDSGRAFADGVVLVGYRQGASALARDAARASVHAQAHHRISPRASDVERLTLPAGLSVADAVTALRRNGSIRFAEPDYVVRVDDTSNDPGYVNGHLWGLYGPGTTPSNSYGSRAGEAWAAGHTGSDDVHVAVIDTGIDVSHPDLAGNIWTNPFEIPGNGIDDDGNGYVDDVHGWDFYNDDASVFDDEDFDWHGTHVAGTLGAVGGDGAGVVGVNWAVTMIAVKFIQGEGFTSDAVEAIDYVTDLKTRHGLNIVATNNSWGGPEHSTALRDAINRAGDEDIVFVTAAGNAGADIDLAPSYPAAHRCDTRFDTGAPRGWDCLVSVAAISSTGTKPGFSNYGATTVDLGAPGVDIVSTYPGGGHAILDGTSMATPHVTGSLALLASCQASPVASELVATLLATGTATPSMSGVTVTGDRLNVAAMMVDCEAVAPPTAVLTVPSVPVNGTVVEFTAWFSDPVSGLETTDFSVGGTSSGWSVASVSGSEAGPYTITVSGAAPTDGTLSLTLLAHSVEAGGETGPPAAVDSGMIVVDRTAPTATAPAAAVRTGVSLSGTGIPIRLSWGGSDGSGSGVARFELSQSSDGGTTWSIVSTSLTSASNDLTVPASGKRRFRIRAIDAAGNVGAWAVGPILKPRLVQESAGAISYKGKWKAASSSAFSGGATRFAGTAKYKAIYTFAGRAVGFVTTRAPSRGVVKIKVDGVLVATIDLHSGSWIHRRLAWQKAWSSAGTHTVKIIVVGTSGRPRIDLDAFAVLK